MNIIVAGEESGVTRDAFAALGHNAWSCDLKPSRSMGGATLARKLARRVLGEL